MNLDHNTSPTDIFIYDETSPSCLRWKHNILGGRGMCTTICTRYSPCGTLNANNLWHVRFRGSPRPIHRVIWEMFYNDTDVIVSHINGNKSDNRIENLTARKTIKVSFSKMCADNREWSKIFAYDSTSPSGLRWIIDNYVGLNGCMLTARAGEPVHSYKKSCGYSVVNIGSKKTVCLHVILYELMHGKKQIENVVDHIDGNKQNNSLDNLREVSRALNTKNSKIRKGNTTGVTGVTLRETKSSSYFIATWSLLDGTKRGRSFSIKKLGKELAFTLACEYRAKMIEELNSQGAGYTERHGK